MSYISDDFETVEPRGIGNDAARRLDTLLAAADFATNDQVDPRGLMRGAMCLAVDPDLLITVNAMSGGYVVSDDPAAGLNSPTHPGTGQQAATEWLDRLRQLAQRVCVTPTVYAQADLRALQRVGDAVLSSTAITDAGPIVNQLLGITSLRGATVVGDGPLTGPAVRLLSAQPEPTMAIAAAPLTADESGEPADTAPRRYSDKVTVAPFDPCVAAALAGAGRTPISPGYLDTSLHVPLIHDSPVARRQDAIASVLWRGLQPAAQPRNQILMPPLAWDVTPDDAQAILTSVATAIHSGLAVPRPMPAVIAEAQALPPTPTATPPDNASGNPKARYGDGVTSQISTTMERIWGLTAALTLKKQGYTNVTVFEANPDVGGKVKTVLHEGRPYEMGAIWLDKPYATILALIVTAIIAILSNVSPSAAGNSMSKAASTDVSALTSTPSVPTIDKSSLFHSSFESLYSQ